MRYFPSLDCKINIVFCQKIELTEVENRKKKKSKRRDEYYDGIE